MSEHVTYPSIDAMLEPSVLADVLGRPVESVTLRPMATKGWSSTESVFEAVLVDARETRAAVLKRIRWSTDWHALATDDTQGREIAIWETGVLDRLPPAMAHGVLAVARFEDGAALLMDDLDDYFLPDGTAWSRDRVTGVLRAMAAMHATFWEDPPVDELGRATCRLERMVGRISATRLRSLGSVLPDNELVATFPDGWVLLPGVLDPGMARDLQALADDPTPVVTALSGYPTTLLHGDLRPANVAWDGTRAVAVDWQPTAAPPGFELAYFVKSLGKGGSVHPDEAMATYRSMLADELGSAVSWSWWEDQLDICVAAEVAMMAGVSALFEHEHDPQAHPPWASLRWWVPRVERGLRLIGSA